RARTGPPGGPGARAGGAHPRTSTDPGRAPPVASAPMDRAALQIVGGGKMGEALLAGLLGAGHEGTLRVVETHPGRAEELRGTYPSLEVAGAPGPADGTLVAVKPHLVPEVLGVVGQADGGRVLSIAAGVTIATLEAALPDGTPVVRAMPNTPALVG